MKPITLKASLMAMLLFISHSCFSGDKKAIDSIPTPVVKQKPSSAFLQNGPGIKVLRDGHILVYGIDGRLLLSQKVVAGQVLNLPRHAYIVKFI